MLAATHEKQNPQAKRNPRVKSSRPARRPLAAPCPSPKRKPRAQKTRIENELGVSISRKRTSTVLLTRSKRNQSHSESEKFGGPFLRNRLRHIDISGDTLSQLYYTYRSLGSLDVSRMAAISRSTIAHLSPEHGWFGGRTYSREPGSQQSTLYSAAILQQVLIRFVEIMTDGDVLPFPPTMLRRGHGRRRSWSGQSRLSGLHPTSFLLPLIVQTFFCQKGISILLSSRAR